MATLTQAFKLNRILFVSTVVCLVATVAYPAGLYLHYEMTYSHLRLSDAFHSLATNEKDVLPSPIHATAVNAIQYVPFSALILLAALVWQKLQWSLIFVLACGLAGGWLLSTNLLTGMWGPYFTDSRMSSTHAIGLFVIWIFPPIAMTILQLARFINSRLHKIHCISKARRFVPFDSEVG